MDNILILPDIVLTDIITNSSSEIFICNINKTKEAVEEFLVDLYNLLEKDCSPFVHMTVGTLDYNTFSNLAWYMYDFDFYDECKLPDGKFDHDKSQQLEREFIEEKWKGFDKKNCLVIESSDYNSIPYDIWDTLINTFNARRIHLG